MTTNLIPKWDLDLLFRILDNIFDVVMIFDSDTTIVFANKAYTKILGVPADKVLGRRLDEIEPEAMSLEVLRTGRALNNKREYLYSVDIDVTGSTFPLFDGNKIIGCVSIFNNISESVKLTRELQLTKGVADYLQEQLKQREQLPLSFQEYIGQNVRLRETLMLAAKVAKSNSTVLIRGESGVGKEVLAKAIHNCSERRNKPLIKVNCAAIPEGLLESEFFGFEDGAFTGARKGGKLGKFELAHEGTIFLDEIGDMSLTMQAKLLRVLQEKEFERVGGNKVIKVNIRVIAATNRNLEKMIEEGAFRNDLYYRLNIVPLFLIPLRERKDDILTLANKFIAQFMEESGRELTLSHHVIRILQCYDWPGNVRELHNVLEHSCIVCNGNLIEVQHLPSYVIQKTSDSHISKDKPYDLKETLGHIEKELILAALANNNNNRSDTMKELGISRKGFYQKLKRYEIENIQRDNT